MKQRNKKKKHSVPVPERNVGGFPIDKQERSITVACFSVPIRFPAILFLEGVEVRVNGVSSLQAAWPRNPAATASERVYHLDTGFSRGLIRFRGNWKHERAPDEITPRLRAAVASGLQAKPNAASPEFAITYK